MKKVNLIILSLFIFLIARKVSAVTYDVWTERNEDNDNLVYETKTLTFVKQWTRIIPQKYMPMNVSLRSSRMSRSRTSSSRGTAPPIR